MSIVQNQIRTGYILLATISDTTPEIYDGQGNPLFNLGDSYYNSLTCLIYTVIRDSEDTPMYWGSGSAPIEGHIYLNKALGIFYGVNNGELFANIGTVDLTNPMHVNLDMDSHKLLNVANGTSSGDAVNKGQLDLKANATDIIPNSEKGVADGVATLNSSGKIPSSQLELPIASTINTGVVKPDGVTIMTTADGTLSATPQVSSYTPDLLDVKWSDHLLNNISWLRGDTFSWQSGLVYSTVYNELLSEYNNASSETIVNEEPFVQPVLTSNGVMGGDNFACESSSIIAGQTGTYIYGETYYAFDNNVNTAWHSSNASATNSITFYSPYLLKATNIQITNWAYTGGNTGMKTGIVEASNDNSTWVQLATFTNTSFTPSSTWNIPLTSNTEFYKYYKVTCTSSDYSSYSVIGNLNISGTFINPNSPVYKLTPKGYKIADVSQESVILNKYNSTGVAWYYILDVNNTRFKLPRTKFGFNGLRSAVGDFIEAGLPNITGTATQSFFENSPTFTGAYSYTYSGGEMIGEDRSSAQFGKLNFDASRSNPIYGNSNTVQPPATQMYLYFYVGYFSQSATEQTAGLNTELLNSKADINLSNISNTSGFRRLIEVYNNELYWYKVFMEYNPITGEPIGKWCEQGGTELEAPYYGTQHPVTFLKEFKDINYIIFTKTFRTTNYASYDSSVYGSVYYKTTTGFYTYTAQSLPVSWYACGYID